MVETIRIPVSRAAAAAVPAQSCHRRPKTASLYRPVTGLLGSPCLSSVPLGSPHLSVRWAWQWSSGGHYDRHFRPASLPAPSLPQPVTGSQRPSDHFPPVSRRRRMGPAREENDHKAEGTVAPRALTVSLPGEFISFSFTSAMSALFWKGRGAETECFERAEGTSEASERRSVLRFSRLVRVTT